MKAILFLFLYSFQLLAQLNPLGDTKCGQVNQKACDIFSEEYWQAGECDKGLSKEFDWRELTSFCQLDTRGFADKNQWQINTLKYQRSLIFDRPLSSSFYIGAMNTQLYSPTDLLDMGVRMFHLEIKDSENTLRICQESPCEPQARYFAFFLEEIRNWLKANPDEVILLSIKDFFNEMYDEDFSKTIKFHVGDILANNINSEEKNLSPKDLLSQKKQIVLFTHNKVRAPLTLDFNLFFNPEKRFDNPSSFNFEICNIVINNENAFVPAIDSKTMEQKWFFLTEENNEIKDQLIYKLLQCGLTSLSFKNIKQEKLNQFVWSWDEGQPNQNKKCVVMNERGKWETSECSLGLSKSCFNNTTQDWKIQDICTDEWEFSFPQNIVDNQKVLNLLKDQNSQKVYINREEGKKDLWSSVKFLPIGGKNPIFFIRPVKNSFFLTEFLYKDVRQYVNLSFFKFWQIRQHWEFKKENDHFQIINRSTQNCLSVDEPNDGALVKVSTCKKDDKQLWKLTSFGSDYYQIQSKSNSKCLDIYRDHSQLFNPLMIWQCHDNDNHKFELRRIW